MSVFLIADDSEAKIHMLRHFLHAVSWKGEVLTAMTSEEAFAIIDREKEIAAAFVDYYIPEENGPAIIKRLKGKFPKCRIALVSSADSEKNSEEAKRAGAEATVCTTRQSDEVERGMIGLLQEWKDAA